MINFGVAAATFDCADSKGAQRPYEEATRQMPTPHQQLKHQYFARMQPSPKAPWPVRQRITRQVSQNSPIQESRVLLYNKNNLLPTETTCSKSKAMLQQALPSTQQEFEKSAIKIFKNLSDLTFKLGQFLCVKSNFETHWAKKLVKKSFQHKFGLQIGQKLFDAEF